MAAPHRSVPQPPAPDVWGFATDLCIAPVSRSPPTSGAGCRPHRSPLSVPLTGHSTPATALTARPTLPPAETRLTPPPPTHTHTPRLAAATSPGDPETVPSAGRTTADRSQRRPRQPAETELPPTAARGGLSATAETGSIPRPGSCQGHHSTSL